MRDGMSQLLSWLAERDIAFPWRVPHAAVLHRGTARHSGGAAADALASAGRATGAGAGLAPIRVVSTPLRRVLAEHGQIGPGATLWGARCVVAEWARGGFAPTLQRMTLRCARLHAPSAWIHPCACMCSHVGPVELSGPALHLP